MLHLDPPQSLRRVTAAQLVSHQGGRPESVALRGRAGDAASLLRRAPHAAFPVVDDRGRAVGSVSRKVLEALLVARAGLTNAEDEARGEEEAAALRAAPQLDVSSWASAPGARREVELGVDDASLFLPLRPWMNAAPHTVQAGEQLGGVHALFRALGLRHLLVLRGDSLLGVVTRKDLLEATLLARRAHWQARPLTLIQRDESTMPAAHRERGVASRQAAASQAL